MTELPDWVFHLVLAVDQYEDFHPKTVQPGAWDCLAPALDEVPREVRAAAQLAQRWARASAGLYPTVGEP